MATPMQLRTASVKQQNPLAILGLSIITLGIYSLFWYYRINREMKDFGTAWGDADLGGTSPGMSVLALFVPIAGLISVFNTGKRVARVQFLARGNSDYNIGLHVLLMFVTGLWPLYAQAGLNSAWASAQMAAGVTGAGEAPQQFANVG